MKPIIKDSCVELEGELGDILSKARDEKNGARLVAESIEMTMKEIVRIENYEWTPNELRMKRSF